MFNLFRRKPSDYAVAIRDSLKNEPLRWRMREFAATNTAHCCNGIEIVSSHGRIYFYRPNMDVSSLDAACIREGIEAWIAYQVRTTNNESHGYQQPNAPTA